jgi:hypothetical protein
MRDVGDAIASAEADIQARLQALEAELGTEVSALCLCDTDVTTIAGARCEVLRSVAIGIAAPQPKVRWASTAVGKELANGD